MTAMKIALSQPQITLLWSHICPGAFCSHTKWKEAGSLQTWPRLLGWVGGSGAGQWERGGSWRVLWGSVAPASGQRALPAPPAQRGRASGHRAPALSGRALQRASELNLCLLRALTVTENDPFPVSVPTKGDPHSIGKQFCDCHECRGEADPSGRAPTPGKRTPVGHWFCRFL
uniref:Uncharacterized protein n=1 Tax=Myotis myotis TaxID=51298 RepID=A0A7J7WHN8_MYOMY|nr:hypothetical protein mMyoMyo1_012087 [Myotis myotis]